VIFDLIPNGTYGKRQPTQKGIEGLITGWLLRQARKPRSGSRNGVTVLALTTIGAKTGIERTSPVGYLVDRADWIITATAGGARKHPGWYYNLAAHPDQAIIVVKGERIPVTATQLTGDEREATFERALRAASPMARRTLEGYRKATDRQFPLIRLTRR
jgi:deazaflavin-dependent oxidoreductase (nitroreductase family)